MAGKIKDDVLSGHLARNPRERDILLPFLQNFDVNWAQRVHGRGTALSAYFLDPDQVIKDQFGTESEIVLTISDYPTVQPRTMLLVDDIIQKEGRGRVDQTTFFLITSNEDSRHWVMEHAAMNPQSSIPIVVTRSQLSAARADSWFVRRVMAEQLFARDLFNEQLPLKNDLFFFGRDQLVVEFVNAIKQSQNRGLFGLRKTGKTSLLFKVKRLAERNGLTVLYYDCKDPAIRSLPWEKLIERIIADLAKASGKAPKASLADAHPSDRFKQIVASVTAQTNACIIFDEIEWISPLAQQDPHWRKEFVPFWQTMWTTQSNTRRLALILAGVNPTIVELDAVDQVQNPVFGIVVPKYLTGLSDAETRSMLHHFGKRMGLRFDHDAFRYMFERYGGHPLLTRMAGSYINSTLEAAAVAKPTTVAKAKLVETEADREQEISFYCRHITSELKQFYPAEYEMLEMLAAGNTAGFLELASDHERTRHLKYYGLVTVEAGAIPSIKIPVMKRFINAERIKREQGAAELYLIKTENREAWISSRIKRITSDLRRLERLAEQHSKPVLYGPNGFPDAEKFAAAHPVANEDQFQTFINTCNRCFVEAVEREGKSQRKTNYFWNDIRAAYPEFWRSLHRIKLYRHDQMHLELTDHVDEQLKLLLADDLQGKKLSSFDDPWFMLQQLVLDGIFVGVQIELEKLS